MVNKDKLNTQAQKFLLKGQVDKALKEYQKILQADPNDINVRMKIGDLYLKKGEREGAANEYCAVAEHFSKAGFYNKAIAVFKQALGADPNLIEIDGRLGELYLKVGLANEATLRLQHVADHHERKGNRTAAVEILKRLLEIRPHDIDTVQKLITLSLRDSDEAGAREVLRRGAPAFQHANRMAEFVVLYRTLVDLSGRSQIDVGTLKDFSFVLIDGGEAQLGCDTLRRARDLAPTDREVINLLVKALMGLNESEEAKEVLRGLAAAYRQMEDAEKERSVYEEILTIDSADAEARSFLKGSGGVEGAEESLLDESALEDETSPEAPEVRETAEQKVGQGAAPGAGEPRAVSPTEEGEEIEVEPLEIEDGQASAEGDEPLVSDEAIALLDEEEGRPPEQVEVEIALDETLEAIGHDLEPVPATGAGAAGPPSQQGRGAGAPGEPERARVAVKEEVGEEDSQTHYDLGIAYKEMGLVEEAIREFELGKRTRQCRTKCLGMLGLCYLEQGEPLEAVRVFQMALQDRGLLADQRMGIQYELAWALEAYNRPDAAMHVLTQIVEIDPNYRDAKKRLDILRHGGRNVRSEGDKGEIIQGRKKISYV